MNTLTKNSLRPRSALPGSVALGMGLALTAAVSAGSPANDDCANGIDIDLGDTQFDTTGATTDGPTHPLCEAFGDNDVAADIWFNYTADFTGDLTVSTCDQADFDTKIAVYDSCNCPVTDADIIGCNDDGPGCTGFTSELTVPVTEGTCYKIRVGGFGGATGSGTLTLSGEGGGDDCPAQCDGDINGDANVDGADLGLLLGAFGDCPPEGTCCADINSSGNVDGADLGLLLGAFGECEIEGSNDDCNNAESIDLGSTEYSNEEATTDGVELPDDCDKGFGTELGADIWFEYTAGFTGTLTVSTCDMVDYDSRLAAYESCDTCPPTNEQFVACNDDGPGCTGFTSLMEVPVTEGTCYLLRVGGFAGATGSGTIVLTSDKPVCGDGICAPSEDAMSCPRDCAIEECPGEGDCCQSNGSPGCNDADCCNTVCDADTFCCDVEWDSTCADIANDFCDLCATP